ncbi:hypothetical protein Pan44_16810 [Caulifigura coniformis]|uniref:Glycosyltransferase RgtA/B/C/D-like domain-containing protein n=2 Tax=Caulifigura coniformis TaxID=2527983 RepID=A0A517SC06_9PLAN|nr:hypothetical protein Pan44_16810 [Caulifigura coniformis]
MVLFAAMVLCTSLAVVWLMSPMLPLGVPGEWGWSPLYWTTAHPFAWISNLLLAAAGIGLVAWLSRRLPADQAAQSSRWRRGIVAGVTMALAMAWWLHLLGTIPAPFGLARSPFVLFYPRMTGYYMAARYSKESTQDFLRNYESMLLKLNGPERYLHLGTHPPGLTLMNRGFQAVTTDSPALVRLLEATMPDQIMEANDTIRGESAISRREFTREDGAALWFITLFTILSAAACIPLIARLLRMAGHSERSSMRWSALWMFTPAVAVFLPKDDVLFAFPSLLAALLWLRGLELDSRWRAAAAGVVCFVGLFFSLAFLPVMLALAIATVWMWSRESKAARKSGSPPVKTVKPRAGAMSAGLAGLLIPVFILLAGFETNITGILRQNFENHAEFYTHNARSYGKWLVANVGELMFAAGPAVFLLAFAGFVTRSKTVSTAPRTSMLGPAGLIVLAMLWLSGKNMGEAARLWIAFLPWLLLCIAPVRNNDVDGRDSTGWMWWGTAGLQAIACIAAATQIDGFGFSELK